MTDPVPAGSFTEALAQHGIERATGVPCGHLAGPWELLEGEGKLIPAASEGAALAIAAGWELGGTRSAVLCQNSGFGNMINPLTSLVLPYRIPVLVAMTLRGWPDPTQDEPQHAVIGSSTTALLEAFSVPFAILEPGSLSEQLHQADKARADGLPFFLLVPRGAVGGSRNNSRAVADGERLTRPVVVTELMKVLTDEVLVTTTGYLSRQAHFESDRDATFYMQGSMGHAAALGLGIASSPGTGRVVVLDGDGAFLMHLGTGSTIGASDSASSLIHIVVDNHCYESTGCQGTTSTSIRWDSLGSGLGYRNVFTCSTRSNLPKSLTEAVHAPGPVLCVLKVEPTPGEVHPRATSSMPLPEIASRLGATVAHGKPASGQEPPRD